jgi:two-component system, sensor histidine kinase LadS
MILKALGLFVLCVCAVAGASFGQNTMLQAAVPNYQNFHKYIYQYADSSATINIKQAIALQKAGAFKPTRSKTSRQEFGFNTVPRWFFFELNGYHSQDLMLEIEYNNIDELELFELKNNNVRSLGKTGDIFKFAQRAYLNNNYVFPIQSQQAASSQYFLYINQPNAILSFTIELSTRAHFIKTDRREYLLWGIYIGVICIVLVINMVMWHATDDKIYIWYSLYVHFMTMHLFADAGLAFQYLWPNFPALNAYHPVYLYIWLGLIVQVIFMRKFIHQTSENSKYFKLLNWFRYFVIACFIGVLVVKIINWPFGNRHLFRAIAFMSSLFVPVIFIITMLSLYERRHDRTQLVKYYGWAMAIQFIGFLFVAFVTYLQTTNLKILLPFDILSYLIIGSILLVDILFFSFGLSVRYTSSQKSNQILALEIMKNAEIAQQKVIAALEAERKRLAQDLHDDLGAVVSTAKGYISMLVRQNKNNFLGQAAGILDEVSTELRSISHVLMPKSFDIIGLAKAIEESVNKVTDKKMDFNFSCFGKNVQLPAQNEKMVFGMATDLINIVHKHTNATEATAQLVFHQKSINFSIEHNATNARACVDKLGNIYKKAKLVNAEISFDTEANSIMMFCHF